MATHIISDPSNGTTGTLPSTAGNMIRSSNWGIDNQISGFIIQSEQITRELITDTTQDQKGAVVSQLDYDEHFTLQLNLIGGTGGSGDGTEDSSLPEIGAIDFAYAGHKWKVNNVTYNGSYQDKKSYSLQCERWHNWPAQGS